MNEAARTARELRIAAKQLRALSTDPTLAAELGRLFADPRAPGTESVDVGELAEVLESVAGKFASGRLPEEAYLLVRVGQVVAGTQFIVATHTAPTKRTVN